MGAPTTGTATPQPRESLFSAKQIVAMALGTALYAGLTIPFNVLQIPGVGLIAIRPTIAIPIIFGIVFGPVTGFVVGLLGNSIADVLSFGGFFWNWDLGNGIIGLVAGVGFYIIARRHWAKGRGLTMALVLSVVASLVGIGFAAVTDYIFSIGLNTWGAALSEFYTAGGTDAVNGAILVPILLYAYATATAGRARRV